MPRDPLLGERTLGEKVRLAAYWAFGLGVLALALAGGAESGGQPGPQPGEVVTTQTPDVLQ
jgi:hypothetical protein